VISYQWSVGILECWNFGKLNVLIYYDLRWGKSKMLEVRRIKKNLEFVYYVDKSKNLLDRFGMLALEAFPVSIRSKIWNDGILESWNDGILEWWKSGEWER